jgi:glycosyltransferase involved in cell wall biosynthesis
MPKRILYIEGNLDGTVGGSYYVLQDLVNALDKTRYEPVVGFHRDNFIVGQLRERGIETVVFPAYEPFAFRSTLLNTVFAPFKKAWNYFSGLVLQARKHAKYLREAKIDLVNLNNSMLRNHAWMLAARMTGTPCMTHEMGINPTYDRVSRFFAKRLRKIVCVSHAIHNVMKRCGVDYPNITVIHCGIDLARYKSVETPEALRVKHDIPVGVPVIGVVGNVRYWKGQETIVRAMPRLVAEFPGIRCLLVGAVTESDREYRAKLETFIREHGIAENVIFAGFQRNPIDYMQLFDVFCHTSVHAEPFGIVNLEAMSRSKPLISTTIGGPAEVVINGETGLLIEPGKPELLADAVRDLLRDPARAAEMGRRGHARLHADFTLAKNVAKTTAVYDEVFARPA